MTEKREDQLEELVEHYQQPQIQKTLKNDPSTARRGIFHQVIATGAVLVLTAACGMPIGYSAVLLPQLMNSSIQNASDTYSSSSSSEIIIDIERGSWVASIHSLATPLGSLISGPLADSIGRRNTLLLSIIPTIIGWLTLALSQSYPMLIAGRFICGFATGILGGPAQVYIAETTEPNLRSLLIGAPFVSYSIGILTVYSLGLALHWRTVAWCGNILPVLAAIALACIPESPAWLLRNHQSSKALRALTFLRASENVAQKELNEMTDRLTMERAAATQTNENIFKLCCQRVAKKPLFIVIVFSMLQMLSGTYIVVFYAIDIISELGAIVDIRAAAIWTAIVRILCCLICCVALLIVRRRRLLMTSGLGSGLSCLVLSVFMYARLNAPKTSLDVYVAAICLMSYIAFNTALMIMPGIMIGELFPAKIRGRTAGSVFAALNISLFGFTKVFPIINVAIKMRGVFLLFAAASFIICLFMYMFQPETKGRTLAEIEDYFNEKNWLWRRRDKAYKDALIKEPQIAPI